jgi:hypothetical protein
LGRALLSATEESMAEVTKFQSMNGCSACKHTAPVDKDGKPASDFGKGFWCKQFEKPVDSKDGAQCEKWEYEA